MTRLLEPVERAGRPGDLLARYATAAPDTFPDLDPSTGEPLAHVPRADAAAVAAAVETASAALPAWAATAPRARAEVLRHAHDLMISEIDELSLVMSLEVGKARQDSRGEVRYAAEFFRWFAEEAVRIGGELRTSPAGTHRILTRHRPVGVSLLLTPWNFPAAMITRKLGAALAAGCTALVKPAEDSPLTALYLADLLERAGLPAGVATMLTSDRPAEIVDAALADPRVRKVSFTGSTRVGRELLHKTAERVVNTSLELGGNAPFVVLDDADLDAAVEGAMVAKLRNGGQACTAANRFLVQEAVAGEFTERLARRMAAVRVGPGRSDATQLGPMVNARRRDAVAATVAAAADGGARVRLGADVPDGPGFYYPPTVLDAVARDAGLVADEIFGPVAPVLAVVDDEDAVTVANGSELGLAAYVYTRDLRRGLALAERLEVGMVGLNRGLVSDPAAPFGGVKESGLGREGGFEGVHEYLELCYTAVDW